MPKCLTLRLTADDYVGDSVWCSAALSTTERDDLEAWMMARPYIRGDINQATIRLAPGEIEIGEL